MRKGITAFLVGFLLLTFLIGPAQAQGGVVLALSGGGAKGLAHIGVLEEIERAGIPVEGIVGTSMGSIIGGLYASGYSVTELREIADQLDLSRLLRDDTSPGFSGVGQVGGKTGRALYKRHFSEDLHVVGPMGGIRGDRLLSLLTELFSRSDVADFRRLPIPFAAVATDLETGEAVVLQKGNLASAIRASMSISGVFTPWNYEGRLLVDGGLVANLPVSIARHLFPGYPVVAVDVSGAIGHRSFRTVSDVVDQTITIMMQQNVIRELARADLVINPSPAGATVLEVPDPKAVVDSGVAAASEALPALRRLTVDSPAVSPRQEPLMAMIAAVEVRGIPVEKYEAFHVETQGWIGRSVRPNEIGAACREFARRSDIDGVDYEVEPAIDGVKVLVLVQKSPAYELGLDVYTTNQGKNRWLYVGGVRRDLWSPGDTLSGLLALGEQMGGEFVYDSEWDAESRARYALRYQEREVSPRGLSDLEWKSYSLGMGRFYRTGRFSYGLGFSGQAVRSGGEDDYFWGPMLSLAWDDMDDDNAPREGLTASLGLWWTDEEGFLGQGAFLGLKPSGEESTIFLAGGLELGNRENPAHAAYLGDGEELYSLGSHPLAGEHAAWARLGNRRVIHQGLLGEIDTEIFGGYGVVFDEDWKNEEDAWELGLAFFAPFVLFDSRFFVTYDDRSDWTFGFSLGTQHRQFGPLP